MNNDDAFTNVSHKPNWLGVEYIVLYRMWYILVFGYT